MCLSAFMPRVSVCLHRSLQNLFSVILYYHMNFNLKFHNEWNFCCNTYVCLIFDFLCILHIFKICASKCRTSTFLDHPVPPTYTSSDSDIKPCANGKFLHPTCTRFWNLELYGRLNFAELYQYQFLISFNWVCDKL